MRSTVLLLDGSTTTIDVPRAQLGAPLAIGVLRLAGIEVEVNAGTEESLTDFLTVTGSRLTSTITLRAGQTLRLGPLHSDAAAGLAFAVEVGNRRLFGAAAPALPAQHLASGLTEAAVTARGNGIALHPTGSAEWSPYRTQGASSLAELDAGGRFLLDIRRTVPGSKRAARGVAVKGGRLSKGTDGGRRHVVLDTDAFVVFGIPTPQTDLDLLTQALSEASVTLS